MYYKSVTGIGSTGKPAPIHSASQYDKYSSPILILRILRLIS